LRQILTYMAAVDSCETGAASQLLAEASAPAWPDRARTLIARVLEKAQAYSAFPVAAAGHLGYPVLKKSTEAVSAVWRAAFLRAVDDGVLRAPLLPVLSEARARTRGMG
jgi:hypothetical protein